MNKINTRLFFLTTILISLNFYRVKIIDSFTISDASLILFIVISAITFKRVKINLFNINYLVWLIFSSLPFLIYIQYDFFSIESFMLTSLRISFSILCLFFIPLWLTTSEQKTTFIIAIKYNLLFILYSQIIIVILFYIGYENIFNLITSNNWENRAEILNVYDYRYYFRFGGLFEEPSWFSWYITYLLGIIISYEYVYKLKILNKKIIFLLLIAISFTFSISGLLSIVLLLTTRHFIHYKKMKHTVYFLFISFALVAIVLTNEHFMERLLNILSGSDGSSNVRVFGSFYRLYIILENLALGTGVGNSINGIEYYSSKYNLSTEASISSQNGFVEAFISTGLISGLLYCIPIFLMLLIKKYRVIFLTIVLVYFTTSSIYIAPMWILLGISFYLFQPSNNQITTEKS